MFDEVVFHVRCKFAVNMLWLMHHVIKLQVTYVSVGKKTCPTVDHLLLP